MSTFNLQPGKAQLEPYTRPQTGVVVVRAGADGPVRVQILDSDQRAQYLKGGEAGQRLDFDVLASATGENVTVSAPVPAEWFLVVENVSREKPVSGSYAVSAMVPSPAATGAQGPVWGEDGYVWGDPRLRWGAKR